MTPVIKAYYENSWYCIDIGLTECMNPSVITLNETEARMLVGALAQALGLGLSLGPKPRPPQAKAKHES